ncbi:MAG: VOC family protein [Dehalococcoidia bacterium]|nr:VOC family protein [Dehalococcoidia bacterium]
MIEGLEHVGIGVQDLEKAKAFYENVLGFQVFAEREIGLATVKKVVFMRNGDDIIELLHMPDSMTSNTGSYEVVGLSHICFKVRDFAAEVDRWISLGISQVVPPSPTADGNMRTVFRGPSGEFIELRGR